MVSKKTYTAQSVDDAITNATLDLGVPSSELGYEVIDKGSKGFLGFGSRQAIITAWVKETEEKAEKAQEKKPEKKQEAKPEKKAEPKPEKKQEPKPEKKAEPKSEKKQEAKPEKKAEPKPEKKAEVKPEVKEEVVKYKTTENDEAHFAEGKQFLLNVFEQMNMKVEIEYAYNEDDNALEMNLSGDEMGVLIGKRGQTLDSLQYLTSLVINKSGEHYIRVKLDTENYRERRKETLEALAKNIAYKVKRTRRSVSLEPMNPYERRIIHSALQQDNFVMTKSEGEEPFRHVVVFYRRNRNGEER